MKTEQIPRSEIQYIENFTLDGQLKNNKPQFGKKLSQYVKNFSSEKNYR